METLILKNEVQARDCIHIVQHRQSALQSLRISVVICA
jgi:hypothetical protein